VAIDGTGDAFRFLDLPAELRDRVYMLAAEACSDLGPLRLRSQRYVKTACIRYSIASKSDHEQRMYNGNHSKA